jgi:hypothetical protein
MSAVEALAAVTDASTGAIAQTARKINKPLCVVLV